MLSFFLKQQNDDRWKAFAHYFEKQAKKYGIHGFQHHFPNFAINSRLN
jgi:hypothetical protein